MDIEYVDGTKEKLEFDKPYLMEEMWVVAPQEDFEKVAEKCKHNIDNIVANIESTEECLAVDLLVVVSGGINELKKVQGPTVERVEDVKNNIEYARYARNIEFRKST